MGGLNTNNTVGCTMPALVSAHRTNILIRNKPSVCKL